MKVEKLTPSMFSIYGILTNLELLKQCLNSSAEGFHHLHEFPRLIYRKITFIPPYTMKL